MAGRICCDRPFRSFEMTAKAQRRRRAGGVCGSAALTPPRAGNGGSGDPLARRSVGSVCAFSSIYNIHEVVSVDTMNNA